MIIGSLPFFLLLSVHSSLDEIGQFLDKGILPDLIRFPLLQFSA
jgi:hypothetical protein